MKSLIVLISFIPCLAYAYRCPSSIKTNPHAKEVQTWLQQHKGTWELHGCLLEITVCDNSGEPNDQVPIGEILVLTKEKKEAYLSLDFPLENSSYYRARVKTSKRALYFEKQDRFYEHEHGRTEFWRFEIGTLWNDTSRIDRLELGIYTTHSQLNQTNGNDSHWFICKPEQ